MAIFNFPESAQILRETILGLFDNANRCRCLACGIDNFLGNQHCSGALCGQALSVSLAAQKRALAENIHNHVLDHLRQHGPPAHGRLRRLVRVVILIESARLEGPATLATLIIPDNMIALFGQNSMLSD
ncbi:uncharacterized protein FRV6_04729 [Fusarium oxysporum]|uniref:Uncharacterized protein n=1 Tax=Fusarium oxysporum TaxID=5507 RepID=A0A2H3SVM3_FUSOX|nr:uncharacterized protein FRV6_04729 [Fusarium oxysporum]